MFSGEVPVELNKFISAPFSTKYFIISKFPFSHDMVKGVSPYLFFLFMSAPLSTKSFTIFKFPFLHEIIKGVSPPSSITLKSTFILTISLICSSFSE